MIHLLSRILPTGCGQGSSPLLEGGLRSPAGGSAQAYRLPNQCSFLRVRESVIPEQGAAGVSLPGLDPAVWHWVRYWMSLRLGMGSWSASRSLVQCLAHGPGAEAVMTLLPVGWKKGPRSLSEK